MHSLLYAPPFPIPEQLGLVGHFFQARLEYVSTSQIRLQPFGGGVIRNPFTGAVKSFANGAGPTLGVGGMSNSTLYHICLDTSVSASAGQLFYETSISDTLGVPHKLADLNRLVCGAVYVVGGQFVQTASAQLVVSLYNTLERSIYATGANESGITANGAWQVPTNPLTLQLLRHPWRGVKYTLNHFTTHNTATRETRSGIDVGSTGTPDSYGWGFRASGSTDYQVSAHPDATQSSGASFAYEATRVLVWGQATSTLSIVGGAANRLEATLEY